jgi:hypothetical protein
LAINLLDEGKRRKTVPAAGSDLPRLHHC